MDRVELTQDEKQNLQVMKSNIATCEAQLNAWKFGFQSMLNAVLNRTVSGIDASYTLNPEGTALVRDATSEQRPQAHSNGVPLPVMDSAQRPPDVGAN